MATDDGAISPDQPTDRPTDRDRRCWRQAGKIFATSVNFSPPSEEKELAGVHIRLYTPRA